jgi:hypothetical protein
MVPPAPGTLDVGAALPAAAPAPFSAAPMPPQPVAPVAAPAAAPQQPQQAAIDLAAAAAPTEPDPELVWPCPKCGTAVPMASDYCEICGTGFLADARGGSSITVPVFGEVGTLTSGRKVMIGILITLTLIVAFVVIATIGGKVL